MLQILLYLYIFAENRTQMQTNSRKIQTAFRLNEELVGRLKLLARRENKSLNRLVEEQLERLAPAEPQWPKIKFPIERDKFFENWQLPPIPPEDIEADERLAYILSK